MAEKHKRSQNLQREGADGVKLILFAWKNARNEPSKWAREGKDPTFALESDLSYFKQVSRSAHPLLFSSLSPPTFPRLCEHFSRPNWSTTPVCSAPPSGFPAIYPTTWERTTFQLPPFSLSATTTPRKTSFSSEAAASSREKSGAESPFPTNENGPFLPRRHSFLRRLSRIERIFYADPRCALFRPASR